MFLKLLTLIGALFLGFYLIKTIRSPKKGHLFSRENWSKSFFSMGILALLLMGFVALCVFVLRLL
jgi:hypothetical protein